MNKIVNHTAVLFALVGSSLFANIKEQDVETMQAIENSFAYVSANIEGVAVLGFRPDDCLLAPGLGLGYRMQKNHHGLDLSMCFSRLLQESENVLKADIFYNYFFNPNLESQWYAGVGIGVYGEINNFFKSDLLFPVPKCVLGKQYKNTFVEVQVYSTFVFSGVSLKCGIGF